MMLNVWGVIWRAQKKIILWTRDNAANGTPIPDRAKYLARQGFLMSRANFVLSFPCSSDGSRQSLSDVWEIARVPGAM